MFIRTISTRIRTWKNMLRQRPISSDINMQPTWQYSIMIMPGHVASERRLWERPGIQAWSVGAASLVAPQHFYLLYLPKHQWLEDTILKISCWRQPLQGFLVCPMR